MCVWGGEKAHTGTNEMAALEGLTQCIRIYIFSTHRKLNMNKCMCCRWYKDMVGTPGHSYSTVRDHCHLPRVSSNDEKSGLAFPCYVHV